MMMSRQVRKGMLVWDPFVGTGSILVAAAHLGAQTFGTDIDIRVIKFGAPLTQNLPTILHPLQGRPFFAGPHSWQGPPEAVVMSC